jgi:NAD+ diphosphatase
MLGFIAQAASTAIHMDGDELEHARWFTRDEMRREISAGTVRLSTRIAISHHLIASWFDAGDLGLLEAIEDAAGALT